MPKLAIYVPKKDMREIERWRKKINFSKVFMRALQHEIRDRTRTLDASDGQIASAAQYYKQKLLEGAGPLVDFGHSLGTRHVLECQLAPETIHRILEIKEGDTLVADNVAEIETAIGSDMRLIDEHAAANGYKDESHPTWRREIYRGYVQGVAAAWQRVCEEMNHTL